MKNKNKIIEFNVEENYYKLIIYYLFILNERFDLSDFASLLECHRCQIICALTIQDLSISSNKNTDETLKSKHEESNKINNNLLNSNKVDRESSNSTERKIFKYTNLITSIHSTTLYLDYQKLVYAQNKNNSEILIYEVTLLDTLLELSGIFRKNHVENLVSINYDTNVTREDLSDKISDIDMYKHNKNNYIDRNKNINISKFGLLTLIYILNNNKNNMEKGQKEAQLPIIIFKGLTWNFIKSVLDCFGYKVFGNSDSKRHILNFEEFNLTNFLINLDLYKPFDIDFKSSYNNEFFNSNNIHNYSKSINYYMKKIFSYKNLYSDLNYDFNPYDNDLEYSRKFQKNAKEILPNLYDLLINKHPDFSKKFHGQIQVFSYTIVWLIRRLISSKNFSIFEKDSDILYPYMDSNESDDSSYIKQNKLDILKNLFQSLTWNFDIFNPDYNCDWEPFSKTYRIYTEEVKTAKNKSNTVYGYNSIWAYRDEFNYGSIRYVKINIIQTSFDLKDLLNNNNQFREFSPNTINHIKKFLQSNPY